MKLIAASILAALLPMGALQAQKVQVSFGIRIGVPSVLKAYTLNGDDYFVTIAFGGEVDGAPFLDMIVELKATPHGDGYRFHCPFEERTKDFHETTLEDVSFRYSGGFRS